VKRSTFLWLTSLLPLALTRALSASDEAPTAQEPPRLRVAVLPGENATGDASQGDWEQAPSGQLGFRLGSEFIEIRDGKQTRAVPGRLDCIAERTVDTELADQAATESKADVAESRDPSKLEALRRRVRNGDPVAQVELANILFEEQPPRHEEGMHWLRKAAERDNARAQRLYAWSLVALRREDAANEAVTWLARAANQGDIESQYDLGLILYEGKLVPRDPVAAGQWILLAADRGYSEARRLLQEMELLLNPDSLAEARECARAFVPTPCEAATGKDN